MNDELRSELARAERALAGAQLQTVRGVDLDGATKVATSLADGAEKLAKLLRQACEKEIARSGGIEVPTKREPKGNKNEGRRKTNID